MIILNPELSKSANIVILRTSLRGFRISGRGYRRFGKRRGGSNGQVPLRSTWFVNLLLKKVIKTIAIYCARNELWAVICFLYSTICCCFCNHSTGAQIQIGAYMNPVGFVHYGAGESLGNINFVNLVIDLFKRFIACSLLDARHWQDIYNSSESLSKWSYFLFHAAILEKML